MMLQPHPASNTVAGGLAHHGKRKAADTPENNERLSKRLSLLNIEQGSRRYLPVAHPPPTSPPLSSPLSDAPREQQPTAARVPSPPTPPAAAAASATPVTATRRGSNDSTMQVDDSKYKVYVYNMDDELASGSESEGDDSKIVLLADVDKHLRDTARSHATGTAPRLHGVSPIPRPVPVNADGELAGMQLVLYNDPSSLSVPRAHDSVRQAILDARDRIRQRQRSVSDMSDVSNMSDGSDMDDGPSNVLPPSPPTLDDDSDAMDMD